MQNIITKNFHDSSIRIFIFDNKELFLAKDTAELLGYSNTKDAIIRHCKHAKSFEEIFKGRETLPLDLQPILGNSWKQTKLIPESDVWRLIIKSRLPEAEKIEEWIMEEVLPSIRKTGSYSLSSPNFSELLSKNEEALKLVELFEETKPFRLLLLQKLLGEKSVSSLFGIDFSKTYFLPTELGKLHGLSGRETNLKLEALGFQEKQNGIWKLTSSGKEFGIEVSGTYHQLKWKLETL